MKHRYHHKTTLSHTAIAVALALFLAGTTVYASERIFESLETEAEDAQESLPEAEAGTGIFESIGDTQEEAEQETQTGTEAEAVADEPTTQAGSMQGELPVYDGAVLDGVQIGGIDVSGLTAEKALSEVNSYFAALKAQNITLTGEGTGQSKEISLGELGLIWDGGAVVTEAVNYGHTGNIVQRYKERKDLTVTPKTYPVEPAFSEERLTEVLGEECKEFTQEAVDYRLTRENGSFSVAEGQTGYKINVEASKQVLRDYLEEAPDAAAEVALVIEEEQPKGSYDELSKVRDVLGTFTTSYKTSSNARSANIANGCRLAQGATIYPGEEFSVLDHIQPFTEANGYYLAGSYLNGQVVDSLGGGICQVSTTLYNAVLKSELEVTERHNHSMIVTYVQPSMDAAIAESSEKDFRFVNNTAHPIYIDGYTEGKSITFTIYGVEERDAGHKVRYESETLTTTPASADVIHADASQPVGFVDVQSAHTGYTARLWRIVTENGTEVSREVINESSYKMTPRTAVVGTATDNPANLSLIQSAIASGSIDQCKSTAAALRESAAATDPAALAAATYEAAVASGDPNAIAAAEELIGQVAAMQAQSAEPVVDVVAE